MIRNYKNMQYKNTIILCFYILKAVFIIPTSNNDVFRVHKGPCKKGTNYVFSGRIYVLQIIHSRDVFHNGFLCGCGGCIGFHLTIQPN